MDSEKQNVCPECGVDLETGEQPKPEAKFDRRAHAIAHWGTDAVGTISNPEARARAEKVLGSSSSDAGKG